MFPSRLETITDTVFGFAITLLVISNEVPATYVELQASMYGFIGFVFCINLLLSIWASHNKFFLHCGLRDQLTTRLNFLFFCATVLHLSLKVPLRLLGHRNLYRPGR
ncbi:MAG: TMEM175 family protein [Nonlabens sp.]